MHSNIAALTQHVKHAQAGDKSAFAEIVQCTQNLVASVALAIVQDVKASEDVAQEAYILEKGGPCGRRLDFMMQEFNREANTLASKSINSDITATAAELKVLIEQMREQIQNIE